MFSLSSADWETTKGFGAEARGPGLGGICCWNPAHAVRCYVLRSGCSWRGCIQTDLGQGLGAGLCWQNI